MKPPAVLVQRHLLDPLEAEQAAAAPIADAVNIPLSELPGRTHELPPREEVIRVAATPELAERTVSWLTNNGRHAAVQAEFEPAVGSDTSEVGRLWQPNAFLVDVLGHLPPAAALDLACGTGRDAVHMASRGWDVTAVDILPDALERARDLARRCAPAIRPVDWRVVDLEHDPPAPGQRFDLIVGFRYLHRPLFRRLADWLNPAGSVVYETFTTVHRERYGKPARPSHALEPNELPGLLKGLEIVDHSEGWRGAVHTARVWARVPGRRDGAG